MAQSPLLGTKDIMRTYVDAMRAADIGTGVYFQLEYDYWGGFLHGKMSPNGPGAPKLTGKTTSNQEIYDRTACPEMDCGVIPAEQYFNVTTQMLAEIWGEYGDHTELWFDGGLVGWSAAAIAKVGALMAKLQPNAVAFQGPTLTQAVRWSAFSTVCR